MIDIMGTSYQEEEIVWKGWEEPLSKPNVVAVIPARGNSKSIPRKNMKPFRGKPLVQWTIEAAMNAKSVSKVVVTTEDEEIARLSFDCGVRRIISRPEYLSQDHVQLEEVVLQALRVLEAEGEKIDLLVILQPTSPFRNSRDIDDAVKLYWRRGGPVISGCESRRYHWEVFDEEKAFPIRHDPHRRLGRQWEAKESLYVENGAVYVVDAQKFSSYKTIWYDDPTFYVMDKINMVELDELEDWEKLA